MFVLLLNGLVNGSNHTKFVSFGNKKSMTQPNFIDLHPSEYSQKFHYYQFVVKLVRSFGSCNMPNNLSNKVCVLKTKQKI